MELSKGREVGMSKACVSKSEPKNILGEHHRVDGAGSVLVVKGKDQTQELIPALPLTSCVTSAKFFKLITPVP